MAWGGSLNKNGTEYLRKLREADRVISFLESLKEELNNEEQGTISKTIEIIIEHISKISEKKR